MTQRMKDLAAQIVSLQGELDREIESKRKALGSQFKDKFGAFEHGIVQQHRLQRRSLARFWWGSTFGVVITTPVIYSLVAPMAIADAWVSVYQAICFRVYGIPQVRRADYILLDRQHLKYLNAVESLNCTFCAYANGVVGYVREIASRTEQYWCPIKHALKVSDPHKRYYDFLEYGDAEGYRSRLADFRARLKDEPATDSADATSF